MFGFGTAAQVWRSLTIPVEVPPMQVKLGSGLRVAIASDTDCLPNQIISQSSLTFPSADTTYRVGEPIDVRTRIETSTAWSTDPDEKPVPMMYDIITDKESWLVAGPKRGSYLAEVSPNSTDPHLPSEES